MMNQFSTRMTLSRSRLALFLATALLLTGCGQSGNLVLPQKIDQNGDATGYTAPAQQAEQPAQ